MTIKEFTITGYTINDMPNDTIKEKILDKYRYELTELYYDNHDYNLIALDELQGYGFNPDYENISWELYCQGSGLSFICDSNEIDLEYIFNSKACQLPHKKTMIKIIQEYCNPHIIRNSTHYCHSYTCTLDYDGLGAYTACIRIDVLIDKYMNYLEELYHEACYEAFKRVEEMNEADSSDEAIITYLEDNEFYFDKNGRWLA